MYICIYDWRVTFININKSFVPDTTVKYKLFRHDTTRASMQNYLSIVVARQICNHVLAVVVVALFPNKTKYI